MRSITRLAILMTGLNVLVVFTAFAQENKTPVATAGSTTSEREQLLSKIDDKEKESLVEIDKGIKQEEKRRIELEKKYNSLMKVAGRSAKAHQKTEELFRTFVAAGERLEELKEKREELTDSLEQERREILARHPLPGEKPLVKQGNRWLTQEEHQAILEKEKAAERQEELRKNGQRLATWVWMELGEDYEFEYAPRSVVLIKESRVRFVSRSPGSVYSLTTSSDDIELRAARNHSELDDTYTFQIQYTNGLGQLIRKDGYVEIGYDSAGTAYVLGVVVPFLDNPLNGQLAVTRSSLDNALQRAFGR